MIWGKDDFYFVDEIPNVNRKYFSDYRIEYGAGRHWCLTDYSFDVNKKIGNFLEE